MLSGGVVHPDISSCTRFAPLSLLLSLFWDTKRKQVKGGKGYHLQSGATWVVQDFVKLSSNIRSNITSRSLSQNVGIVFYTTQTFSWNEIRTDDCYRLVTWHVKERFVRSLTCLGGQLYIFPLPLCLLCHNHYRNRLSTYFSGVSAGNGGVRWADIQPTCVRTVRLNHQLPIRTSFCSFLILSPLPLFHPPT